MPTTLCWSVNENFDLNFPESFRTKSERQFENGKPSLSFLQIADWEGKNMSSLSNYSRSNRSPLLRRCFPFPFPSQRLPARANRVKKSESFAALTQKKRDENCSRFSWTTNANPMICIIDSFKRNFCCFFVFYGSHASCSSSPPDDDDHDIFLTMKRGKEREKGKTLTFSTFPKTL